MAKCKRLDMRLTVVQGERLLLESVPSVCSVSSVIELVAFIIPIIVSFVLWRLVVLVRTAWLAWKELITEGSTAHSCAAPIGSNHDMMLMVLRFGV
jgi:hypothetical protein